MDRVPDTCVVFDTETTGFSPEDGDRLVEIGAVKMVNGLPTDETFHVYINPERTVPEAAVEVHGLTTEFLSGKPLFREVAGQFLAFVEDMPLAAHNAEFDKKFINSELRTHALPEIEDARFVDTVAIARKKLPGQKVNLDSLCRKFRISLDGREKHGALIDSQLLAEVCVELNGGRQGTLFGHLDTTSQTRSISDSISVQGMTTRVIRATPEERSRHMEMARKLGDAPIWMTYLSDETTDPDADKSDTLAA